jgi:Bacterial EndoU nuclease
LGHPEYAVEVVGNSKINPSCLRVKFYKSLPGGQISNLKSPASTLFPKGWSQSFIIQTLENIANKSGELTKFQISNGTYILRGTVKGIKIEIVIDRASKTILAGYPL